MNIDKFSYDFLIESNTQICEKLKYISNNLKYKGINKETMYKVYGLTEIDNDIYQIVEKIDKQHSQKLIDIANQLRLKWLEYKDNYFDIISKIFGFEFSQIDVLHRCYLHILPINEIGVDTGDIYLNSNVDIDSLFAKFIVMLTKLMLINKWKYVNTWKTDFSYEATNKVWLFAEIAIDAIFAHSALKEICQRPAYKYFYNIRLEGVNIIDEFRKLYTKIELNDFFDAVYMFVSNNFSTLLKFDNYLY